MSVGADHQAELPALRPASSRRRARPDRLLWDPSRLPEHEVERYQRRLRPAVVSAVPAPAAPRPTRHLPDHEQVRLPAGQDDERQLKRDNSVWLSFLFGNVLLLRCICVLCCVCAVCCTVQSVAPPPHSVSRVQGRALLCG